MDRFLKPSTASSDSEPPKKKKKYQKFREQYKSQWPCLSATKREGYAYCSLCRIEFSIAHGGNDDCRRHMECKRHKELNKAGTTSQSVSTFFSKTEDHAVIKAESYFTRFLIEHNIPIAVADHAAPVFKKMFKDSEVAQKYSSGRTKTGAIIRAMASTTKKEKIIDVLVNNKFSLATDGSNDISERKLYPLVVSFFDPDNSKVRTTVLSLLECTDNTGEGIFTVIDKEFKKLNIPWRNCISFGCDSAATMTGKYKGVSKFIEERQPKIKVIRCVCHMLHNSAQKATQSLPVDVESFIVQIYYFLDKSSKRQNRLKEIQVICGEETRKILKHVSTRWLSLDTVLKRVVEQWEPLYKFFVEDDSGNRESNQCIVLKDYFESPETKLYCLFLSNVLSTFTKPNISLQRESPYIHLLVDELQKFYFELIARFITPSAVSKSETVFDVNFSKLKNQKEDEDLIIGSATRAYLKSGKLSSEKTKNFYAAVRKFFCSACDYVLKKLPLQSEFYQHASIANLEKRLTAKFDSIEYFIDRFNLAIDIDQLQMEFALYQTDVFPANFTECERIDELWAKMGQLKHPDGTLKYKLLSSVMLCILVVPHSNAPTERVFSMVKKNANEYRASISIKTLESILVEKLYMDCCFSKTFTESELKTYKSACYNELRS